MTDRFDALQEALLTLYEEAPTDIDSQIKHWDIVRQENIILYYCRKEGISRLGMHIIPALQVSEYKAKEAIQMLIYLRSLKKSQFSNEEWTLTHTSAELFHTEPKNTFKKQGYHVEVWYDNQESKAIIYPNWEFIYYQDAEDKWHKTRGEVDYDGLYFREDNGDTTYFVLFYPEAQKYGETGMWTVRFKQQILSTPVTSSSRKLSRPFEVGEPSTSEHTKTGEKDQPFQRQQQATGQPESPAKPSSTTTELRRRRTDRRERREGEPRPQSTRKRRRADTSGVSSAPSPEQVGSRHRLVEGSYHTRLGRLQAEAWDPPIIIVQGASNTLKSWRRRYSIKYHHYFTQSSTVWSWVGDVTDKTHKGRMLIAFQNNEQRESFLRNVKLPKGSSAAFGSLNAL